MKTIGLLALGAVLYCLAGALTVGSLLLMGIGAGVLIFGLR